MLSDYISRVDAVGVLRNAQFEYTCDEAAEFLLHIPAADVREVKRGQWIEDRAFGPICSVCGKTAAAGYDEEPWPTPYCPFCGARMEENNGS